MQVLGSADQLWVNTYYTNINIQIISSKNTEIRWYQYWNCRVVDFYGQSFAEISVPTT
jgi:hypothetical protein